MSIRGTLALPVFCMAISINVAAADREPPEVTMDGLHRVNGTKMALVYAKPDVDLSQYKRIYLAKPQIAFKKDWLKEQNRVPHQYVRNEDMQRIKSDLANLFMDEFKQELQSKGGYILTNDIAEDVLIVHPAIVDLNVIAPTTPGTRNSRSLRTAIGSMTLYMELMDATTGDMLVKALDNKYRRNRTTVRMTDSVRNEVAARDMLGEWAELLRLGLDEARAVVSKH